MIDNRLVFLEEWYKNGIKYYYDLIRPDGKLKTKNELEEAFNLTIKLMDYNCVTHALPKSWKKLITENKVSVYDTGQLKISLGNRNIKFTDLKCRDIYSFLTNEMWQDIFTSAFEICEETLLQTFQYKILNRFFPCNYVLSKWYKDKLEICEYCTLDSDTLEHYFFYCKDVHDFWMSLYKWWKRIHGFIFPACVEDIIFGIYNPQKDQAINTLNYCILYGKYYIYCTKSNGDKIFLFNFLQLLKNKLDVLYTQHCVKNKVFDFMSRWSLIYENV